MKTKDFFLGNNIIINLIYAGLFIMLFDFVWKTYCVPVWHAFFYKDYPQPFFHNCLGYFFAIFPIIFYRGIKNVSSWICIILYYFGYVPIVLSLLYNFPEDSTVNVMGYWIVLCLSMSFNFLADRFHRTPRSDKKNNSKRISIGFVWFLAFISVVILFAVYHNNMRLSAFNDVYGLRAENAGQGGAFIGYLSAWAATYTFPMVFCYGLITKKKIYIIIGCLLFIFLYSIFGLKSHCLAPLILLLLYKFFQWQEKKDINLMPYFTIGIGILSYYLLNNLSNPEVYTLAAVFLMRTLTISGCLFSGYYVPFFESHPNTYFTHINILDYLTGANPYHGQAIGNVVSNGGMNANAIFWAMDGVTAMDVAGVFIVSVLFFLFLLYINTLTTKENKAFLCTMMVMPTMALLNVSFFTFLLSEGVILLILTIKFVDIPIKGMRKE